MKRFLLVDDHSIVRSGVRLLLREKYLVVEVDEAADGNAAFDFVKSKDHDLIFLDLHIPNTDIAGLINNIISVKPQARILVFSMSAENVFAKRYLQMGVWGYLNKECADEEIGKAIDTILSGRRYISPQLMLKIAEDTIAHKADNPFENLSNREMEIVILLINGKTVSEITNLLHIQHSTASTHKARIFEKLNVTNIIDLRELARLYQLI